jgi:hypothetical protein
LRARQTAARLRQTPLRAPSRSAYSASVTSFRSATSVGQHRRLATHRHPMAGRHLGLTPTLRARRLQPAAERQGGDPEAPGDLVTRPFAPLTGEQHPLAPVRQTGSGHDLLPSNHPQTHSLAPTFLQIHVQSALVGTGAYVGVIRRAVFGLIDQGRHITGHDHARRASA